MDLPAVDLHLPLVLIAADDPHDCPFWHFFREMGAPYHGPHSHE